MDLLFVLIAGLITLAALDVGETAARSRTEPVRVMSQAKRYRAPGKTPSNSRNLE